MADIKERFIAEALELLSRLEKSLLMLEVKPDNILLTQEIFRGLHTLKGSSAMYGFEKIGHLMHLIESVFDKVREKQLVADSKIVNLALDVVDFTNKVLKLRDDTSLSSQEEMGKLVERIGKVSEISVKEAIASAPKDKKAKEKLNTYYVYFQLDEDFEKRGVKLDSIFRELDGMGSIISIPVGSKEGKSSAWEIFIVSKSGLSDIEDVFIFLSDLAEISLLGEENLFLKKEFNSVVQKNAALKTRNSLAELKRLAEQKEVNKVEEIRNAPVIAEPGQQSATSFLRVAAEKLDEQMDLLSELVTAKAELRLIVESERYEKLFKLVESIDKTTNRFRKNILNARLVQVKTWYVMFLRLVRDISRQLKKEVEFLAEGLETEIDKNIIDSLEGPLTHLIRNSLDHGIESPEEREKAGKPKKGTVTLKAHHSGSSIVIEICDDGRGIDREKIRQKAISKGLIDADSGLNDKQLYDLIFLPGFSTAQNLSEVSGRGVGMDVVKKAISQLRGEIEVRSHEGKGTDVIIKLPMLLSIIDTLLIKTGPSYFAIPLPDVYKCTQFQYSDLEQTANEQLHVEGELIPYINLRRTFGINGEEPQKQKLVVVQHGGKLVGLTADEVVGEYQAVLKPFDGYFINRQYFIGASLLADGQLCVILDTVKLVSDKLDKTI